jgi:hypothetical protein
MSKLSYIVIICTIVICLSMLLTYDDGHVVPSPVIKEKKTFIGNPRNVVLNDNVYGIYLDNNKVYFLNKVNKIDMFVLGKRTEFTIYDNCLDKVEVIETQGSPGPIGSEPVK